MTLELGRGADEPFFPRAPPFAALPLAYQWAYRLGLVTTWRCAKARGAEMPEASGTDPLMYQVWSDTSAPATRPDGQRGLGQSTSMARSRLSPRVPVGAARGEAFPPSAVHAGQRRHLPAHDPADCQGLFRLLQSKPSLGVSRWR